MTVSLPSVFRPGEEGTCSAQALGGMGGAVAAHVKPHGLPGKGPRGPRQAQGAARRPLPAVALRIVPHPHMAVGLIQNH